MELSTHPQLAPRLKKEQSYTSTPPLGLHGFLERPYLLLLLLLLLLLIIIIIIIIINIILDTVDCLGFFPTPPSRNCDLLPLCAKKKGFLLRWVM